MRSGKKIPERIAELYTFNNLIGLFLHKRLRAIGEIIPVL